LTSFVNLLFAQLLGDDLTDAKSELFVPLIGRVSKDPKQNEFRSIFLNQLYKKCPYTVPLFPERQANMTDEAFLK
jgi:hypothetical protein